MAVPSVSAAIKLQSTFCDSADGTDIQHNSAWVFGSTRSARSVAVPQMYGRGDTYINSWEKLCVSFLKLFLFKTYAGG